jgi:hypothetical protein
VSVREILHFLELSIREGQLIELRRPSSCVKAKYSDTESECHCS